MLPEKKRWERPLLGKAYLEKHSIGVRCPLPRWLERRPTTGGQDKLPSAGHRESGKAAEVRKPQTAEQSWFANCEIEARNWFRSLADWAGESRR